MILFCGIPTEPPLALAIAAAQRSGIPHLVLNQRQTCFADIALEVDAAGPRGTLHLSGEDWPLTQFDGIYNRLIDVSELPECRPRGRTPPDPTLVGKVTVVLELLQTWLDLAPGCVVNRPSVMGSNASKPYQAQLIRRAGLLVPPTLITNDPDEVRAFAARHGRIIFKSISSIRSIVTEWTPSLAPSLSKIRELPVQFQAMIAGSDVRVHVVGDVLFATRIDSSATDYRYAAEEDLEVAMSPAELPPSIAKACLSLSETLQLPFCGIDFKRTPRGEYYCFEVNPSPAYSYYEEHAGQAISEELVRLLSGQQVSQPVGEPMQIVENWATIEGQVESVEPNRELPGFASVRVAVRSSQPVPGFPNLFSDAAGQTISVNLPSELANRLQLRPGATLRARTRKSGPDRAFVHSDHVEVL